MHLDILLKRWVQCIVDRMSIEYKINEDPRPYNHEEKNTIAFIHCRTGNHQTKVHALGYI